MKLAKDYREQSKTALKGNFGKAILVFIIYLGLSAIVSSIPLIGTVAAFLLEAQLTIGMITYYSKLLNKEKVFIETLFDDFDKNWFSNFLTNLLRLIYIALWSLLFIIPGIMKAYSYAMTLFLKYKNPKLGHNEAIALSSKIMYGKRWKLFCLYFSFFGWYLLCCLTLGIGFIFLAPYEYGSIIAFYEDAYNEYRQTNSIIGDNIIIE